MPVGGDGSPIIWMVFIPPVRGFRYGGLHWREFNDDGTNRYESWVSPELDAGVELFE
jgi:hypothetical protein